VVMLFMDTAVYLFDDWFDPIEAVVRDRVRGPAACRSHPWAAIGPGGSSCPMTALRVTPISRAI
jgi:hypothetical protein